MQVVGKQVSFYAWQGPTTMDFNALRTASSCWSLRSNAVSRRYEPNAHSARWFQPQFSSKPRSGLAGNTWNT